MDLSNLYRCLKTGYSSRWRRPKRLIYGWLSLAAIGAVYLINVFTRFLDEIFFPGYRLIEISSPLIITANPRSGTTFLHRLISLDEERFTSFRLRDVLLPSISMGKLMRLYACLDRALGSPLKRAIDGIFERGFGMWDNIHSIGFSKPEEDEGLFIFTFSTAALYAVFPFFKEVPGLRFADFLPERKRKALVRYYRGCIKRFLYANGRNRTFLLKSVLLSGRLKIVH
ncbi:MAG TPA: hypothetical protein VMX75_11570, partial [Spirochaetia bacterium]|nr:hypothetical protein [Spirochaetia bacterium]